MPETNPLVLNGGIVTVGSGSGGSGITALTSAFTAQNPTVGDVKATGPGSTVANVVGWQGIGLDPTTMGAPTTGNVPVFNGTDWVANALSLGNANSVSGILGLANGGTGSSITSGQFNNCPAVFNSTTSALTGLTPMNWTGTTDVTLSNVVNGQLTINSGVDNNLNLTAPGTGAASLTGLNVSLSATGGGGNVSIQSSGGDINLSNTSAGGALTMQSTTGALTVQSTNDTNLNLTAPGTGDVIVTGLGVGISSTGGGAVTLASGLGGISLNTSGLVNFAGQSLTSGVVASNATFQVKVGGTTVRVLVANP